MLKTKTLVKICGITSIEQAIQVANLGADAIGIVSVEESPRFITHDKKREIFKTLKNLFPKIKRVSVVKNLPIDLMIKNLLEEPIETTIQLHGDEDLDYCRKLKNNVRDISLWKAFRIKNKSDIDNIKPYENFIDAILLDSWDQDKYGGSGKRIEQKILKNISFIKPWWLAGGVSKKWIVEIIKEIKPYGIDVSSSVECSPGIKNIDEVGLLINEIRKA